MRIQKILLLPLAFFLAIALVQAAPTTDDSVVFPRYDDNQPQDEALYTEHEPIDDHYRFKGKPNYQYTEWSAEHNWWSNHHQSFQHYDWANNCDLAGDPETYPTKRGLVIHCWLSKPEHFNVRFAMQWIELNPDGSTETLSYDDWPLPLKRKLYNEFYEAYDFLRRGVVPQEQGNTIKLVRYNGKILEDPPTNLLNPGDEDEIRTGINKNTAEDLYINNVAMSLAVEIGGFVPWSISTYNPGQLFPIFSAREFFKAGDHIQNEDGGYINPDDIVYGFHGYSMRYKVIPAPSYKVFRHFLNENAIQKTQKKTVAQYLRWARDHLRHFGSLNNGSQYNGNTAGNAYNHWDYRGVPPVSRIIDGVAKKEPYSGSVVGWVMGCHGASHFLMASLRLINIPVKYQRQCLHGVPLFMTLGLTMSHGDDIYGFNNLMPYPSQRLLVTHAKWSEWFSGDSPERCTNIGRQYYETVIDYPPMDLIGQYCQDLRDGKSHAEGQVFDYFSHPEFPPYTVEELEQRGLWVNLSDRLKQHPEIQEEHDCKVYEARDFGPERRKFDNRR